jgi:hypothetical protein
LVFCNHNKSGSPATNRFERKFSASVDVEACRADTEKQGDQTRL